MYSLGNVLLFISGSYVVGDRAEAILQRVKSMADERGLFSGSAVEDIMGGDRNLSMAFFGSVEGDPRHIQIFMSMATKGYKALDELFPKEEDQDEGKISNHKEE